ncbi:hypothetical protein SteCoe_29200 [Stentor coeruleus]|uniref:PPM-type phosphatase domain-containing protein n=1 Tax=Stentor coeruleus TaxID=5963 RepID=A0A1R2B6V1_9CILI|nr:hypothetical protein SteCoe_29200 [Stentor coeruleus]
MERKKKKKSEEIKLPQAPQGPQIIIKSSGSATLQGISQQNPTKKNQDTCFQYNMPTCFVCGVADGHGHYGEFISKYISDNISSYRFTNKPNHPQLYNFLQNNLKTLNVDIQYSGSTLSLVTVTNEIIISNVGDSCVILGSLSSTNKNKVSWNGRVISKIHKLEDREEAQRISQSGGRITWGNPSRLWLRNEDVPGLAVTRAIGDIVANRIGLIYEPYVYSFIPTFEDKWLVVCSDGVTDSLSIENITKIVGLLWKNASAQTAAEKLVNEARKCCTSDYVDDTTCVVVYIN